MFPSLVGPSVGSNGFTQGARTSCRLHSCSFGTGNGSTSHSALPLSLGWAQQPSRLLLHEWGGWTLPSWSF